MTPSPPTLVAPVPHEARDPAAAQQAAAAPVVAASPVEIAAALAFVVEATTAAAASADRSTITVPLTVALPAAPRGANPPAAAESAAPPRRAALSLLTSILRERARLP